MAGFDNEILYAQGIDLSGGSPVSNKLNVDGFVYIGNSSGNPVAALPSSPDNILTITGGPGTLNLSAGTGLTNNFLQIATATAEGKILRSNGTNWAASTASFPDAAGTNGNVLTSDGTNWISSTPALNFRLISTATASNSASISFTGLSSTYFAYHLIISNLRPATDGVNFLLRTSTNNGSSYDSGASDYGWANSNRDFTTTATSAGDGDDADSAIQLNDDDFTLGNATNEISFYNIVLYNPSGANYFNLTHASTFTNTAGVRFTQTGSGMRLSTADVDAIRLLMSAGNIATGTFKLYGITAD